MKRFVKFLKDNFIYLFLITFLGILVLAYIYKDSSLQAHDMSFHIANIKNLLDKNLFVSFIMPKLGNNLGYGLYIFYPFLPHFAYAFLSSALQVFNISLIDSILLVNIFTSILSGIFMYLLSYRLSKSRRLSFLSSIIYMFFPYRLGTITVRMALNENFAALFIPLILLSLTYLFDSKTKNSKFYLLFVIGYVGLIFSHYLIAFYFSIFLILILILNFDLFFKKEKILIFLKGVLLVSILVLPNVSLFLEHVVSNNYLITYPNYVTSKELIDENILSVSDLVVPTKNYDWNVPFYIYLPVLVAFLYSTYSAFNKKNSNIMIFAICSFLVLFMTVSNSFWEILPDIFYNIQFPWRLLVILSCFVSLVAPFGFSKLPKKWFVLLCICILVPVIPLTQKLANRIYHYDYSVIDFEAGRGNIFEYYPSEYLDYTSYYENKESVDVIKGSGDVTLLEDDVSSNLLSFEIRNSNGLILELPRLYYKGYVLKDDDGSTIDIEKCDNGLLCTVVIEDGIYELSYLGTSLYLFFSVVRLLTIILLPGWFVFKKIKK